MKLYLGLDSSTQGIKGIMIDVEKGSIVRSEAVNFSSELPKYKSVDGVLSNPDPLVKHSDPLMWLAALDLLFAKFAKNGALLGDVAGISGSGQQHGSVYFNSASEGILAKLDPRKNLPEQIAPALSRKTSPIWMDSSTNKECREISDTVGALKLQQLTGSPAIERFTGPQIRKFWKNSLDEYENTQSIHLVSSFMASVLSGENVSIDYGDGAGMNLLNLKTLGWDAKIADATAPGLLGKLLPPRPSSNIAGRLHPYFAKYGLKPGIPVAVWSGDNPCSLVGVGAASSGTAVISLGTSDTFFAAMKTFKVDADGYGHVFGNPAGGFMSLICFRNGSLAREKIKNDCGVDWAFFDGSFKKTIPGSDGNMMLPYFVPETTPLVLDPAPVLAGRENFRAGNVPPDVKIRAIVESQIMSMKLHSGWIGENFSTVRITGGASRSAGICQVIADVFQAEVQKISVPDSAALGAAMRAANAVAGTSWKELSAKFAKTTEKILPDTKTAELYKSMLAKYAELERRRGG